MWRDLVPFIQFKKREKHSWKSVTFSKVAGLNQDSSTRFFKGTNFEESQANMRKGRINLNLLIPLHLNEEHWHNIRKTNAEFMWTLKCNLYPLWVLTLSWRRPLSNHWTGFYMITASIMKEFKSFSSRQMVAWLPIWSGFHITTTNLPIHLSLQPYSTCHWIL